MKVVEDVIQECEYDTVANIESTAKMTVRIKPIYSFKKQDK